MIGRLRWAWVAGIAVAALLIVAIAARSGPSHPFAQGTATANTASPTGSTPAIQSEARATASAPPVIASTSHTHWLGTALVALLAAAAVLGLARQTRGTWRLGGSARRRGRYALGADQPADDPTRRDELAGAVAAGLDTLETGPVSDAVLLCWVRLERAASAAGIAPRPSDTSTELVTRVLRRYGASGPALTRLAGLFREARFSRHELGEPARDEARRCLRAIAAELDSGQHDGLRARRDEETRA